MELLVTREDAVLLKLLRAVGFQVSHWNTAEPAPPAHIVIAWGAADIAAAQKIEPPSHILAMPVMDGFTFLHQLRATPEHSNIPVVVATARVLSEESAAGSR